MRMRLLLCFVALMACNAVAQQTKFEVRSVKPVSQLTSGIILMPIKCLEGSVYVRFNTAAGLGPVVRIDGDGSSTAFAMPALDPPQSVHGIPVPFLRVLDFSPNGSKVTLLTESTKKGRGLGNVEFALMTVDESGHINVQDLHLPFIPTRVAQFPSGTFLVSGYTAKPPFGRDAHPFLALVDSHGQMLREVTTVSDLSKDSPQIRNSGNKQQTTDDTLRDAIAGSELERGEDGRIYVARSSNRGPVFAISESGEVATYNLKPPQPDAILAQIKVAHGQIAIQYLLPKKDRNTGPLPMVVQIIDAASGEQTGAYELADLNLGAALACYAPSELTFLRPTSRGALELIQAVPQ